MRKDNFYRCLIEKNKVTACKTQGFSERDVGLHKGNYSYDLSKQTWAATHIPTGLGLTSNRIVYSTRKEALKAAYQAMRRDDFETILAKYMESDFHKQFSQSRYKQNVTEVL